MNRLPQDILFEYLRDIIFEDSANNIDISELPEEFRDLGRGLEQLSVWLKEARDFQIALADGHLNVSPPPRDNVLARQLKSLQAAMNHITWQAQQVAKGDYSQHIDFMGELSDAFNEMTDQLKEKTNKLQRNMDNAVKTRDLFKSITDKMDRYVMVVENETERPLYFNAVARDLRIEDERLFNNIFKEAKKYPRAYDQGENGWCFEVGRFDKKLHSELNYYYEADSRYVAWGQKAATMHLIEDISDRKRADMEVEKLAYIDSLTGLHNRHYIMPVIDRWLEEKKHFCLSFIDLDHLKQANDEFGHEEGDRYIKQAVSSFAGLHGDIEIARVGGDEFLLLAENMSQDELACEMEEKRKSLTEKGRSEKSGYNKTFSYGIVEITPEYNQSRGLALREADDLMYEYKMAHRQEIE